MEKQSFTLWLRDEAETSQLALIALIQRKDEMLYFEAPELRSRYMEEIGSFEEEVMLKEIEVASLERQTVLIQAAINQRREINMEEIKAQAESEINELLFGIEKSEKAAGTLPSLTEEERREMQEKYKRITGDFHPQINKSATKVQRELYDKAVEAYKTQSLEAIRIIYNMLYCSPEISSELSEDDLGISVRDSNDEEAYIPADYSLAAELYKFFIPVEEDMYYIDLLNDISASLDALGKEVAEMLDSFPFITKETLENKEMKEEYLADLRQRLKTAERRRSELTKQIAEMTGEV